MMLKIKINKLGDLNFLKELVIPLSAS